MEKNIEDRAEVVEQGMQKIGLYAYTLMATTKDDKTRELSRKIIEELTAVLSAMLNREVNVDYTEKETH